MEAEVDWATTSADNAEEKNECLATVPSSRVLCHGAETGSGNTTAIVSAEDAKQEEDAMLMLEYEAIRLSSLPTAAEGGLGARYSKLTSALCSKFVPSRGDSAAYEYSASVLETNKGEEEKAYHQAVRECLFSKPRTVWEPVFRALYRRFCPSQLPHFSQVLAAHSAREDLLWCSLIKTYLVEAPPMAISPKAASTGSVGHPDKCSGPCKYHWKQRGCKDGLLCSRCHICPWQPWMSRGTAAPKDKQKVGENGTSGGVSGAGSGGGGNGGGGSQGKKRTAIEAFDEEVPREADRDPIALCTRSGNSVPSWLKDEYDDLFVWPDAFMAAPCHPADFVAYPAGAPYGAAPSVPPAQGWPPPAAGFYPQGARAGYPPPVGGSALPPHGGYPPPAHAGFLPPYGTGLPPARGASSRAHLPRASMAAATAGGPVPFGCFAG